MAGVRRIKGWSQAIPKPFQWTVPTLEVVALEVLIPETTTLNNTMHQWVTTHALINGSDSDYDNRTLLIIISCILYHIICMAEQYYDDENPRVGNE